MTGALLVPQLCAAQSIGIVAPAPSVDSATTADDELRRSIDPSTDAAPGDDAALAAALNYDPATFKLPTPKKFADRVPANSGGSVKWGGEKKADGSGSITVDKTLNTEWDARLGGDLAMAGTPSTTYDPRQPLPGTYKEQRAGAAWANVTVPDVATVELRVAPSDEQRKFATSLQRSVPLGLDVSLTLQNDLAMTETLPPTPAAPATQIWDSTRKVKLNIAPTGTTFAAAASNSSVDDVTHHTLSAEQKIYGGFNVTTSVTDPGQPTSSKSVKAGFKMNW
ncbi:MAG: hypothetical protein JO254_06730 [Pseudolabrys sp.]|nr:hypothetical protein [Pseudolabrys sp.]